MQSPMAPKHARALRYQPTDIAMVGLGIALAAGVCAVFFGEAFFTGQWWFAGADPADPDDKGLPSARSSSSTIGSTLWFSDRS